MKRAKRKTKRSEKGQRCVSNKRAGRKYQHRMAKRLGGKSVGTIEGQDIEHPVLSVETKKMKSFPSWLIGTKKIYNKKTKKTEVKEVGLWSQTLRNCPPNKIPIALIHQTGTKHEKDLVIIKLEHFELLVDPKNLITKPKTTQ